MGSFCCSSKLAGVRTSSSFATRYVHIVLRPDQGASTLFGPHTLSAYIQEISKLAKAIALGTDVEAGEAPQDLSARQLSFLPPSLADAVPMGAQFGDVTEDVRYNVSYSNGDVVRAVFRSGCPRNDLLTEGTFTAVERMEAISGKWVVDYDDDDWSVKMEWKRPRAVSPLSFAAVEWQIPEAAPQGVYRLRHFGAYKHISGEVKYFTGTSSAFVLQRQ